MEANDDNLCELGVGKVKGATAYLGWEELSVLRRGNGKSKKLLNGLTGFAQPHRIMAIMGPSGSGKSTLLDALAGMNLYIFSFLFPNI